MESVSCDVLIVGGGTGGTAAALTLKNSGLRVILTEPTDWIGGQLTSQAVPPDEHPWIEQFGCTRSYREYRTRVRQFYREHRRLSAAAQSNPEFNPGGGWVSKLCHEPAIGFEVLKSMLGTASNGLENPSINLTIRYRSRPISVSVTGDIVKIVRFLDESNGNEFEVAPRFVLDATELGDVTALAGFEYRIGAESQKQTGEQHAVERDPEPDNVQGITWCFAMGFDPEGEHVIDKPPQYEKWKAVAPSFWAGPFLSWNTIHAHTGEFFTWTCFLHEHPRQMGLFDYRQIVSKSVLDEPGVEEATVVNWPQNDYFEKSTLELPHDGLQSRYFDAKQLSLSLLYWLQTEAERPDGTLGYPGLRLRPDLTHTPDGFAMHPYIRESRRMETEFTVCEQHVATHAHPSRDRAPSFWDSVGVGAYRIDLHPSTNGRGTVDFSSLPFEIPLGALIPVRAKNLLPACKNLGVTHITNGCYRLHPVEWNIGEASAALAAMCLEESLTPQQIYGDRSRVVELQNRLQNLGVELKWPLDAALRPL